ncbi:hypothetical protein pipiens_003317, partial [Culex pipiens pipiens]
EQRKEGEQGEGWVTIPIKEKLRGRGLRQRKATDADSDPEDLFKVPDAPKLARLQGTRSRSLNSRKQKENSNAQVPVVLIEGSPSPSNQKTDTETSDGKASEEDAAMVDLK